MKPMTFTERQEDAKWMPFLRAKMIGGVSRCQGENVRFHLAVTELIYYIPLETTVNTVVNSSFGRISFE